MKNVKIWLGLAYIIFLGLFLYFLLTYISIEELTSYSFLKSNSEYLINFKQNNIIFSSFVFIIFGIVWISLLQGFGSPLGLICGYIFGPYLGTLIFSLTIFLVLLPISNCAFCVGIIFPFKLILLTFNKPLISTSLLNDVSP